MATVTANDLAAIFAAKQEIRQATVLASNEYYHAIRAEHRAFEAAREADPDAWARLATIKAIMSSGAPLDPNIDVAKVLYEALISGWNPTHFEDVKALIAGRSYGTAAYGNNVRAIIASWEGLKTLRAEDMTWDGLTALVNAGVLFGLGMKTRSWALALYDSYSPVITLDRHMLRGFLRIAGVEVGPGDITISAARYAVLSEWLVANIADLMGGDIGLLQWALWNVFRGEGHSSHIALVQ